MPPQICVSGTSWWSVELLDTTGLFGTAHNSFMCCCQLVQTLIYKTVSWVKLFFSSSHKTRVMVKLKKVAYSSSLFPRFFFLSMHEVVGEPILPNIFQTQLSLT